MYPNLHICKSEKEGNAFSYARGQRSKPRLNTHSRPTPALPNLKDEPSTEPTVHTATNTKSQKITYVLVKKQYFSGRLVSFQTRFTWKSTYREPQNFFTKNFKNKFRVKCFDTVSGIILAHYSAFHLENSTPR